MIENTGADAAQTATSIAMTVPPTGSEGLARDDLADRIGAAGIRAAAEDEAVAQALR